MLNLVYSIYVAKIKSVFNLLYQTDQYVSDYAIIVSYRNESFYIFLSL